MRVFTPCRITAGKLYVMSMESFSVVSQCPYTYIIQWFNFNNSTNWNKIKIFKVLKTSMSYFTVMLSMR